jgi:hypothetical protein
MRPTAVQALQVVSGLAVALAVLSFLGVPNVAVGIAVAVLFLIGGVVAASAGSWRTSCGYVAYAVAGLIVGVTGMSGLLPVVGLFAAIGVGSALVLWETRQSPQSRLQHP